MAPTSGGQYHWTSEFAPTKYQKWLSYASGWQSSLGWIASTSSAAFVVTTLIEAMIIIEKPDFAFLPWQYTLMMLGFLFVTIFLNTWGAKVLPGLHTFSLFVHIGGFFITFIALWVMCPRNAPKEVFLNVVNSGGWSNIGTSCLVSQVTVIYCNIGKNPCITLKPLSCRVQVLIRLSTFRKRLKTPPSSCPALCGGASWSTSSSVFLCSSQCSSA
jgi:choline transport protein